MIPSYPCYRSSQLDEPNTRIPQQTYIVFESALLTLFAMCIYCGYGCTKVIKVVIGTFLRISQICNRCERSRIWESQPFIGATPAGNLLMSSAILYTGSLPSKALKIFEVLKCASITRSTFFRHQTKYLQPAVLTIWRNHQEELLKDFQRDNKALLVAGDGRADSPGHSAKYGCYTLLELSCNKVVEFKLVQVGYIRVMQTHNQYPLISIVLMCVVAWMNLRCLLCQ